MKTAEDIDKLHLVRELKSDAYRELTEQELADAKKALKNLEELRELLSQTQAKLDKLRQGCDHPAVYDTETERWPYRTRTCAYCGYEILLSPECPVSQEIGSTCFIDSETAEKLKGLNISRISNELK